MVSSCATVLFAYLHGIKLPMFAVFIWCTVIIFQKFTVACLSNHGWHIWNMLAAILAVQAGAGGIMVSNHGARQLNYVPATISVLEEVCLTDSYLSQL